MAVGMIKTLESRITAMKEFDASFVEQLKQMQEEVNALQIGFNADKLSQDKSVRSHIRKRSQAINNVVSRFKRDFAKVIADVETNETVGE